MGKTNEVDPPERLGAIYASEEKLRQAVRNMEARFVRSFKTAMKSETLDSDTLDELQSNLEWFLTWRLKLSGTPVPMWCDGFKDLEIVDLDSSTYQLRGLGWVGPETDVSPKLCPVSGTVVLEPTVNALKSYSISIAYDDHSLLLTEAY